MKTFMGYYIQIRQEFSEMHRLGDPYDARFSENPATVDFSGTVFTEEQALEAVRKYFKKVKP